MRVTLDCEAKYLAEEDPWGIGEADSARYDLYVELLGTYARARRSVLDLGCGFGAMLARLRADFERLHGVELSAEAIAKGAMRHPFIEFEKARSKRSSAPARIAVASTRSSSATSSATSTKLAGALRCAGSPST